MHTPTLEPALLVAGALIALAILATRLSLRLGVPALVLFLATGMLAGSDGPGGIAFDDPLLTWSFSLAALAVLLFAGGLETSLAAVRSALSPALVLATVGVAVSTAVTAGFYVLISGRPLAEGVLLGAIVSSTDAAAVFGVLRSAGLKLRGRIGSIVELESGCNDPMAIFLTLTTSAALVGSAWSPLGVMGGLVGQMGIGAVAGVLGGRGMRWALNRLAVPQEGLYPVFALALTLILFAGTALLHGSGFLAIYVAGVVLGAAPVRHRQTILRFHDALAWVASIAMFLLLGLLVFPSHLPAVAGHGLALSAFLLFFARPLSVFLCLTPFRVPLRDQAMISWVGLRGAVPIVLAIWPRIAGVPGADRVFDMVFFVVLVSVIVQGGSLAWVARRLGVVVPDEQPAGETSGVFVMEIPVGTLAAGRALLDLGLPTGALVVLIHRAGAALIPHGATTLAQGDQVRVLVQAGQEEEVERLLGG